MKKIDKIKITERLQSFYSIAAKYLSNIFSDTLLISLIILTILVFSFCLWFYDIWNLKDFGLNLFTEFIGVLITVFIIDYLIKRRERKRQIPFLLTTYRDALKIYAKYISMFLGAYNDSVPFERPEKIDDFFSPNSMGLICKYLNLGCEPRVTPPRNYLQYLIEQRNQIISDSEIFLERHSLIADPELYKMIHTLLNCMFLNKLKRMPLIMKTTKVNELNHINLGAFGIRFNDINYENLKKLNKWMEKNYQILVKYDPLIYQYKYSNKYMSETQKCRIPNEIFELKAILKSKK